MQKNSTKNSVFLLRHDEDDEEEENDSLIDQRYQKRSRTNSNSGGKDAADEDNNNDVVPVSFQRMGSPPPVEQDKEQEPADPNKLPYSATVPYSALAGVFEKVTTTPGNKKKSKFITLFFSKYQDMSDSFSVLRLLLPQLDKERQTYGMKETVIGKLFVEILGISPTSEDGHRLLHWKRPGTAPQQNSRSASANPAPAAPPPEMIAGDFGNAVFVSVKSRCAQTCSMSVYDVNKALDELNMLSDKKEKAKVLKRLLRRCTAREIKWIVRTIVKELKMGISEKSILKCYHRDALDLLNVCSNLRTVAEQLKWQPKSDVDEETVSSKFTIQLFHPVKPMLASRPSTDEVLKIINTRPYQLETKYDGERVQVHKNGKNIKLFSRNSNDITEIYGTQMKPLLLECVKAERCIIDGELVVWDSTLNRYEDFGKLKTFANYARERAAMSRNHSGGSDPASQSGPADADHAANVGKQLCYIVFDLLYVNDKSVMDEALTDRMSLLRRCIPITKSHQLEFSASKPCNDQEALFDALDSAVANREEGIMLKAVSGTYVPNERRLQWIKLKPEYVEGLGDDLDLLIVGGYYGKGVGRRGGTISHFMLGVAAPGQNPPQQFYSFCKVGSGYSDQELKGLQRQLEKFWRNFNPETPPSCLILADGLKEKPDVWIEPKHSRVLQIKAAQMVPTDKFKAGYTLRFPRVVNMRTDKNWNEGLAFGDLMRVARAFEGRIANRKVTRDVDGNPVGRSGAGGGKRKRGAGAGAKQQASVIVRRSKTVPRHLLQADLSAVDVKHHIFDGLEFCVMNGDDNGPLRKHALEVLIHEFGGKPVQTPTPSTFCVIAALRSVKVDTVIAREIADVVRPTWVVECTRANKLLPFEMRHIIFARSDTKREILKYSDRYGDSFTKDTTPDELEKVFEEVDRQKKSRVAESASSGLPLNGHSVELTNFDLELIERMHFPDEDTKPWWAKFRGYVVYLDRYSDLGDPTKLIERCHLELFAPVLQFYGAKLSPLIDETVTHIVIDPSDVSRVPLIKAEMRKLLAIPPHRACHLVTLTWVSDSISTRLELDEKEYYLKNLPIFSAISSQNRSQKRH